MEFSAKRATISGMPQSTFINPVALPEPLNEAERKFVQCMAAGIPCLFSEKRPTEKIDKGENANVIRADVIRFFVWGGSKRNPITGNAISLSGAHISGALFLLLVSSPYVLALMDCRFDAPVNMLHAEFRSLNLSGSCLPHGLRGSGMHIDGSVFMRGSYAEDEVSLIGADIGGDVDCGDGEFNNEKGNALIADRMKVGGDFFMHNNFSAKGAVQLLSADVGGNVNCDGGKFINKKGYALSADSIKVGGIFSMRDNFTAEGAVRLPNADIGGEVYCVNSKFINEKGNALSADRIKVGGNFLLQDNFTAKGEVCLTGADIGGDLNCNGGEFINGLDAQAARIRNSLHWQNVKGDGMVDLSFATADVFDYDEKSLTGFEFILDGFSYKRFVWRKNVESRLHWLQSHRTKKSFSPQPFEQAAKVLLTMGHRGDAREVLFTMEKHRTKEEYTKLSGWRKHWRRFWRRAWEITTGYNHLVRRMFITSAGIIIASAIFFGVMDYGGYVVPHQPVMLANADYQNIVHRKKAHVKNCSAARQARPRPTEAVECLFPNYPRFNPFSFSVDIFVPLFSLRQEGYWYPQVGANDLFVIRWFLLGWYWFVVIAGWLLTSIFALTITGIWQRQQAGG